MICKIQVSLFGKPATLIYNEDQSYLEMFDRKIGEKVLKDEFKGYFECKIKGNKLTIGKRVKDRSW